MSTPWRIACLRRRGRAWRTTLVTHLVLLTHRTSSSLIQLVPRRSGPGVAGEVRDDGVTPYFRYMRTQCASVGPVHHMDDRHFRDGSAAHVVAERPVTGFWLAQGTRSRIAGFDRVANHAVRRAGRAERKRRSPMSRYCVRLRGPRCALRAQLRMGQLLNWPQKWVGSHCRASAWRGASITVPGDRRLPRAADARDRVACTAPSPA